MSLELIESSVTANEHGNDSLFHTAVEKDSLIAAYRQLSRSAN